MQRQLGDLKIVKIVKNRQFFNLTDFFRQVYLLADNHGFVLDHPQLRMFPIVINGVLYLSITE